VFLSPAATIPREETQVASLQARQNDGRGQQSVVIIIAHKRRCSTSAADANTRRAGVATILQHPLQTTVHLQFIAEKL